MRSLPLEGMVGMFSAGHVDVYAFRVCLEYALLL